MIRVLSRISLFLYTLVSCCTILQACATTGQLEAQEKVGMHIDAVLEFAVEYPLSWKKDRRVTYGRREGEVRWTDPDHPGMLLMVRSSLAKQPAGNNEQQFDQVFLDYPGLEVSARQKVTLPSGEVWQISGRTIKSDLELYLMTHEQRSYQISFEVPRGDIDSYRDIMSRITDSFETMP